MPSWKNCFQALALSDFSAILTDSSEAELARLDIEVALLAKVSQILLEILGLLVVLSR